MNVRDWKADPSRIVGAHYRALIDVRTGKARKEDYGWFIGLPVLAGVGLGLGDVQLATSASVGLLTAVGILSALLFGLMLQLGDRAAEFADSRPAPGSRTSERATFLEEITASAGYGSLVAIAAAILFVVASISHGATLRVVSAFGLAVGVHLILTLMMVMKRAFALTLSNLNRARSGQAWANDDANTGRRAG